MAGAATSEEDQPEQPGAGRKPEEAPDAVPPAGGLDVHLCLYRNVRANNADLPDTATPNHELASNRRRTSPEIERSFVPVLCSTPYWQKVAGPWCMIFVAQQSVSTLFTVVGHP